MIGFFIFLMLINLQPKQIELYNVVKNDNHSIIGYGGSAGGAKSHGIRDVSIILSGEIPGLKVGIFRRKSKELNSNHLIPLFSKYPELREYFNKTERMLYYPNGSITRFGSADNEDDIYDYQGDEYDIIFIDEATHFTKIMIEFLMTRNRSTVIDFRAKTILTMNPGNVGHMYVKRIFIDKKYEDNEEAEDYYFIPAKIHDNVIWCEKQLKADGFTAQDYYEKWNEEQRKTYCYLHSEYAKRLKKLPKELQLAYLEGDWDVFGGQFFKTFDQKKQEIEPFEIPNDWELIGSLDPGYSSPCSFGLTARDFVGNIYRIATYYESERPPQDHADGINAFIANCKWTNGRKPSLIVADPSAFAKKDRYAISNNEMTFADVFQGNGLFLTKGLNDRVQGWWAVKSLFPDNYFIFKNMNNDLVNQIKAVITDGKKVEDIQGGGNDPNIEDHSIDEMRYSIFTIFKPFKQAEKEKPLGERAGAVAFNSQNYDDTSF